MKTHALKYYCKLLILPLLLMGNGFFAANIEQNAASNTACCYDAYVAIYNSGEDQPDRFPKESPKEEKEEDREEKEEDLREENRDKDKKDKTAPSFPFAAYCSLSKTYYLQNVFEQNIIAPLFTQNKDHLPHNKALYLLYGVFLC
jgi:hypothetical protein